MEVSQIIELMKGVSDNGLTDFSYEENGVSLTIKKHPEKKMVPPMMPMPAQPMGMPPMGGMPQMPAMQVELNGAPVSEAAADASAELSGNTVKSPLVGTFYSAGAPDADPYVKVGDIVSKGQTLGIVEAMKLMNEIESEYDGVVKAILIQNGELVQFDQPMFVIE